ncbi:DUF4038 domain-containing protein [Paenibacillus rhizovicinus]|uniref:DUF4038 domain-containing protein n=1 Tax=Paenibacillus rhizovicinus TaxID=2704463 RepID=A0A6C0P4E7_9BACL|nr:glycoside hydrolase family 140 protein [Paenibacillus rhizovicinus]QHW33369.1 DUF4038 domain-containing protein [Paenibacillus rhizovicinus]
MQQLRISEDKRWLNMADGTPFVWIGDTAWELFNRLTREEAAYYFAKRKEQGFNVIQAALLAEMNGLKAGNAYGEVPLHELDSDRPNESYFELADEMIRMAGEHGMYMALLPAWGDKVLEPGDGPRIFNPAYGNQGAEAAIDRAYRYGRWLGSRYRDEPNIVWVLGGDRDYTESSDPHGTLKELWRSMARGLKDGDGGSHLITFHVCRGSSIYFPADEWLDFHMAGSYHFARDLETSYQFIERDYGRFPIKPALDAEPRYEDHPINWLPENGYFDDYETRQGAYWSVFAGACGHTYGCHDVWQFHGPAFEPVCYPRTHWREALSLPGANQMAILRRLMESRPLQGRVPAQELLRYNYTGGDRVSVMRGEGYVWVYSPKGRTFELDLSGFGNASFTAAWLDPRSGDSLQSDTTASAGGIADRAAAFVPPSSGRGSDWILVLSREE